MTIQLIKKKIEINDKLVKDLETVLECAKDGSLQSFIGVGETTDKSNWTIYNVNHANAYNLIGALMFQIYHVLDSTEEIDVS